ncbi:MULTISPECIES: DUF4355 domain-containing protein [unclassified Enterococcus]|uniref:capsid assembly scaffolding protein Gp46 family protein n=1 Tax=unclassified Enterococcus TaxID=2608891 RepID=UPI001557AA40|nr:MULTISPECIES: DUF4355 domain-containing protein [unclassified Enterococcus]MBS7578400.1 DUF4355 domain-containing protein [Enterococcus sp. MMGLQ5-2]MBS7585631.1 DUF4355 domain-containing protein [Enterococcus sp. MMGLQ5-1]NPD13490.1 DUF4355 domain-containing protein [Enterococcus sp. MMGLQ5-1]NPD38232.1 DUF4355 domain-containing protein [Enterococcus sp. MMGLQ5-2]
MSEFTPITTQEEFDKAVQARVQREQNTLSKKYADYEQLKTQNAELEKQVGTLTTSLEETKNSTSTYETTISELNSKVVGYETANLRTRIALQNGLPFDLAERLVGDDEESIKADAERLASFVTKPKAAPLKDTEQPLDKKENSGWLQMARDLSEKGE